MGQDWVALLSRGHQDRGSTRAVGEGLGFRLLDFRS